MLKPYFKLIPDGGILGFFEVFNYADNKLLITFRDRITQFLKFLPDFVCEFIFLNLIHHIGCQLFIFEFQFLHQVRFFEFQVCGGKVDVFLFEVKPAHPALREKI